MVSPWKLKRDYLYIYIYAYIHFEVHWCTFQALRCSSVVWAVICFTSPENVTCLTRSAVIVLRAWPYAPNLRATQNATDVSQNGAYPPKGHHWIWGNMFRQTHKFCHGEISSNSKPPQRDGKQFLMLFDPTTRPLKASDTVEGRRDAQLVQSWVNGNIKIQKVKICSRSMTMMTMDRIWWDGVLNCQSGLVTRWLRNCWTFRTIADLYSKAMNSRRFSRIPTAPLCLKPRFKTCVQFPRWRIAKFLLLVASWVCLGNHHFHHSNCNG